MGKTKKAPLKATPFIFMLGLYQPSAFTRAESRDILRDTVFL